MKTKGGRGSGRRPGTGAKTPKRLVDNPFAKNLLAQGVSRRVAEEVGKRRQAEFISSRTQKVPKPKKKPKK